MSIYMFQICKHLKNSTQKFLVFIILAFIPGANFFAANSYHHHVATNTWLGTNIQKADSLEPGLDHFALRIESKENYELLLEQLKIMNIAKIQDKGDHISKISIFIYDPDRIKIQIYY